MARELPEFGPWGRIPFFGANPIDFWLLNPNSSLRLTVLQAPLASLPLLAGLLALLGLLVLGAHDDGLSQRFRPGPRRPLAGC